MSRILVVEPDPLALERWTRPLQALGHDVVALQDASAASDHFNQTKPDLAIVALPLPEGGILCRELKATPHGKETPVVMVVLQAEVDLDLPPLSHTGCDRVLREPVDGEELQTLCLNLLGPGELAGVEGDDTGSDIDAHLDLLFAGDAPAEPPAPAALSGGAPAPPEGDERSFEDAIGDLLNEPVTEEPPVQAPAAKTAPEPQVTSPPPQTAPAPSETPRFQTEALTRVMEPAAHKVPARTEAPAEPAPPPHGTTQATEDRSRSARKWWPVAAGVAALLVVGGAWLIFGRGADSGATETAEARPPAPATRPDPAPVETPAETVAAVPVEPAPPVEPAMAEPIATKPAERSPQPPRPAKSVTAQEPTPEKVTAPPEPAPVVTKAAPVEPVAPDPVETSEPAVVVVPPPADPVEQAPVEPEPAPVETSTAPVAPEPPAVPVFVAPKLVQRVEPSYPAKAVRGHEGQVVVLSLLVNEQGNVIRIVVDQGIPGSQLEAAAVNAVLRWKYEPATQNGEPAAAWAPARFAFER